MRQQLLDATKAVSTVNYKVSEELPFQNSGVQLYTKNPKTIYVDNPQYNRTVLQPILNGINIEMETTSIKIYFSNDAKKTPSDYQEYVSQLKSLKDYISGNYFRSDCIVNISYLNDLAITMLEYQFVNIIQGN